jgi:hypothetical protein
MYTRWLEIVSRLTKEQNSRKAIKDGIPPLDNKSTFPVVGHELARLMSQVL